MQHQRDSAIIWVCLSRDIYATLANQRTICNSIVADWHQSEVEVGAQGSELGSTINPMSSGVVPAAASSKRRSASCEARPQPCQEAPYLWLVYSSRAAIASSMVLYLRFKMYLSFLRIPPNHLLFDASHWMWRSRFLGSLMCLT